jgi:WD40 repeat protein
MKYFTHLNHVPMTVGRTRQTWGDCEFVLAGHSEAVTTVSISPDGSRIASASMDKTIRIWNTVTGESEGMFLWHPGAVNAILFSSDGSRIVSKAADGRIRIWDIITGKLEAVFKSTIVQSIILSPDGNRLALVVDIWRTSTRKLRLVLTTPSSGKVTSLVFSPDSRLVAAGSEDTTVSIWSLAKGKLETLLKGHSQCVNIVAFSPDGNRVGSAADDIRIWNLRTHHLEVVLQGYSGSVNSFAFSPDGKHVVSAHTDTKIRIWGAETGELSDVLRGVHRAAVDHIAFSRDGSQVISHSEDKMASIWRFTATDKPRAVHAGYLDQANCIIISPDGSRIVSSSDDHKVRIWRTDMEAMPEFNVVLLGHHERVTYIEFSSDGSRFLSASEDRTIRIWNASTGNLERVLEESDAVGRARFTADGSGIITTKRIWNLATGEYVVRGGFGSVTFSDGHRFSSLAPSVLPAQNWKGYEPTSEEGQYPGIISQDRRWIHPGQGSQCWLPTQYRNFTAFAAQGSKVCFGFETGMLLLLEMFEVIMSLKGFESKSLTFTLTLSSLYATQYGYFPEVTITQHYFPEPRTRHLNPNCGEIGHLLTTCWIVQRFAKDRFQSF